MEISGKLSEDQIKLIIKFLRSKLTDPECFYRCYHE